MNYTYILENLEAISWYSNWVLNKFAPYLRGDILEVGCGIGTFTNTLNKYGKVWAIDIEDEYIKKTKKVSPQSQVGLGDIEKGVYFFKNRQFDAIVCLNVIEHIQNDSKALENLHKLLKPSGTLVLLVPYNQSLYGEIDKLAGHYRRYSKSDLNKKITQSNFQLISNRKLNFIGGLGWYLSGKLLKNSTIDKSRVKLFQIIAPPFIFLENFIEPPIGTSIIVIAKKS